MLTIKENSPQIGEALGRVALAAQNAEPLMREISGIMHDEVEENFAQEGRPKWLGLKPPVPKRREGGKILQDSGQLASSIEPGSDNSSAWVGTNKVYAAIHQLGGTINKPAQSRLVRHRTDAKGNLLHSKHLGGHGLIFAKNSHKNAVSRWFEQGDHTIEMPARPFLVISPAGESRILSAVSRYLNRASG